MSILAQSCAAEAVEVAEVDKLLKFFLLRLSRACSSESSRVAPSSKMFRNWFRLCGYSLLMLASQIPDLSNIGNFKNGFLFVNGEIVWSTLLFLFLLTGCCGRPCASQIPYSCDLGNFTGGFRWEDHHLSCNATTCRACSVTIDSVRFSSTGARLLIAFSEDTNRGGALEFDRVACSVRRHCNRIYSLFTRFT